MLRSALLCALLGLAAPAAAKDKPDVILVVWDTTRADHLTPYGYSRDTTPSLNEIAKRGVVFERAYAVAPWTMPSVASIFTGLFTHSHQVDYAAEDWSLTLPDSAVTLAELMKANGYQTHFYTRHAFHRENEGYTQGFDKFDAVYPGTFVDLTSKALDAAGDKPVFIVLYHLDPHSPYKPPEEHRQWATPGMELNIIGCGKEREDEDDWAGSIPWCKVHSGEVTLTPAQYTHLKGLYDGELQHNDVWMGDLWKMLAKRGTINDTALFFTSDHGEGFDDHPRAKVWHLHGYDSNLHVPLIAYYPKRLTPGRVSTPVRTIDLYPTIADVAGLSMSHPINGESLVPLTKAKGEARPLVGTSHYDGAPMFYRDAEYKLMFSRRGKAWTELYDLRADPGEKNNLAAARPDLVTLVRGRMDAFLARTRITLAGAGQAAGEDEVEMLKQLGYIDD
jgi:arylsulfatase A-like enzyme